MKTSYRQQLEEAVIAQKEATDKILRQEAPKHLFIFNKHVLGVTEGENRVDLAPFHKELCNFVQDSKDKNKLILVPRLHLKSTLVTIGYSIQQIINNPNIRILIVSGTYQNAVDFVGAIKDHLTRNENLIELFGNIAKNPVIWANDRFTLSTERTSVGDKEPTVLGVGIESNIVSKHFDLVIMDDVVTLDNSQTAEQMDKVVKRYRDVFNLLEKGGQLVVIGTRWSDADLYGFILDPDNGQRSQFEIFKRQAMEWEGDLKEALAGGDGFKSSLWPTKFDREELQKRYQSLGTYEFHCHLLNDPVPDSEATFRSDWFHYYEETDIKGFKINNYMTIDPAFSTSKEGDYTAIVITGVDEWGNIYVRDGLRAKITPQETIWQIFKFAEAYHPQRIGIEDVTFGKTLGYSLKEEMRTLGRSLPVVPIRPENRSKDERIRGLQPLYANGKVFHNKLSPITRYLEDELKRFPRSTHDDLTDALSYTLDFLVKPRKERERDARRQSYLY